MVWAKRIFLFIAVNFLIVTTISIIMAVFGVQPYLTQHGVDFTQLAIYCLIWGFAGSFISLALSRVMAKWMMGVQVLDASNVTGEAAWLVHTVHSLAQKAGITTMPEVGIYESPELNAFATGPTRNRALVAVSSGILDRMDKNQLEGVLGHEMTHVANGDMVTMTLLQGIVNAFVLFLSRAIGFVISQNVEEKSRYMVRFMVTMVLQIVLSLLGMMVVAAFSRWREYRADAGGADLAGREKMIAALRALQLNMERGNEPEEHGRQEAVAALKISGRPGGFFALMATHPPLEDRIARLQAR